MNPWLQRNPLIVALAVLTALLAVALAVEIGVGASDSGNNTPRKGMAPEAKLLPAIPQVAADQAYAETTARPIFVPTRRPAPELAVAATPAFQRGQFTLQGVIVAGGTRTAMLREKASGKVHRVEAGRDVNGVTVFQIDPEVVTIGMGDDRETVPLTVSRAGGAPAAPGQVAAAPPPPSSGGPFGAPLVASPFPQQQAQPGQPTAAIAPPQGQQRPLTFGNGQPPFPSNVQPGQVAGQPPVVAPGAPGTPPQASTAPMSPEELLARRRARRAQQNQ